MIDPTRSNSFRKKHSALEERASKKSPRHLPPPPSLPLPPPPPPSPPLCVSSPSNRGARNAAYHSRRIKIHRGSDDSGIKIHGNATVRRIAARNISESAVGARKHGPRGRERGRGGTGDWGNADWMGRNRIYEEARKQSGVDRGWGGRERETEISTGSTPGLLLHVRVEIRVGLIRIGRWSRMEERVWGIFLIGWNSDSFQLRRKKKNLELLWFLERIWIDLN